MNNVFFLLKIIFYFRVQYRRYHNMIFSRDLQDNFMLVNRNMDDPFMLDSCEVSRSF